MYRYIQIGSDSRFSETLPRERLANLLKALPECILDTRHSFKNAEGLPWFRINIGVCDADGNYACMPDQEMELANMVELICEDKGDDFSEGNFNNLAQRIARGLGWRIVCPGDTA